MNKAHLRNYNITVLILTLAVLATALYNIAMRPYMPVFYKYLMNNWATNPVTQIYQVFNTDPCPEGDEDFFNFYWSGTIEGCYCPPNQLEKQVDAYLFTTECTQDQYDQGCERVSETNGRLMSFMSLAGTTTRLCMHRMTNFNFVLNRTQFALDECPQGTKRCGGNYGYCIAEEETLCPYNSIVSGTQRPDYEHQEQIRIAVSFFLFLSRSSDGMPITESRVGEGLGVCLDLEEENVTANRSDYLLYKAPRKACDVPDPRFLPLLSIGEAQYFQANGMLDTITALPGYYTTNNFTYASYARTLIPWARNCFNSNLDHMLNLESYVSALRKLRIFEIIVTLVFSVLTVYWSVTEISALRKEDTGEMGFLIMEMVKARFHPKIGAFVVLALEVVGSLIAHLWVLGRIYYIASGQCSDDVTNAQFALFAENFIKETFLPYCFAFLFVLIMLIAEIYSYRQHRTVISQIFDVMQAEVKNQAIDGGNMLIVGGVTAHDVDEVGKTLRPSSKHSRRVSSPNDGKRQRVVPSSVVQDLINAENDDHEEVYIDARSPSGSGNENVSERGGADGVERASVRKTTGARAQMARGNSNAALVGEVNQNSAKNVFTFNAPSEGNAGGAPPEKAQKSSNVLSHKVAAPGVQLELVQPKGGDNNNEDDDFAELVIIGDDNNNNAQQNQNQQDNKNDAQEQKKTTLRRKNKR